MADQWYTLAAPVEGFFRDRGSKFYAYGYPVQQLAEVEEKLGALRRQHHDARHHCYAYRLGMQGETAFASDDGEPAHSAGDPILGAIRSAALTQVLVVVVRYFGGTKLGVRGLIEAYRAAAADALAQASLLRVVHRVQVAISYSYEHSAELRRLLHPFDTELVAADYGEACRQTLAIEAADFPALQARLEQSRFVWERLG